MARNFVLFVSKKKNYATAVFECPMTSQTYQAIREIVQGEAVGTLELHIY